jgi:hypothetical protein
MGIDGEVKVEKVLASVSMAVDHLHELCPVGSTPQRAPVLGKGRFSAERVLMWNEVQLAPALE